MSKFEDLSEAYGNPHSIPNDILYGWLNANRDDLINIARMGVDKIPSSVMGREVRRRCKQDLLFLAGFFLWETNPFSEGWKPITDSRITEESHGVMCREFFVQKDDSKPLLEQSPYKTRLVLWPRGGCKSTVDIADAVQLVLNFPAIRIWFITAADDLAVGLLDEFKGHWIIKVDKPTLMNLFFPEFCVEEKALGNQFEFTCPLWAAKQIKRKEPTVFASSVTSTAAGWHFEVIKADDVVSDRNSESEDQCRKVAKGFNLRRRTLVPKGYVDMVGTRYHDVDLYGGELEQSSIGTPTEKSGLGWVLTENPDKQTLTLIGKAIQIKPEVALKLEAESRPITYHEAGEDGCLILLPDYMPYSYLCGEFAKNEQLFEGQMNQNPRPAADITFDRPMMLRATKPYTEMPFRGPITHVWDFAFSTKKGRDYSTASSAMWGADGSMYVHDLIRQRYKPNDLAKAVVDFAVKWRPFLIAIENAAASNFLESSIIYEAKKTNDDRIIQVCSHIDWFTPDNQKDAKRLRMAALHPWLVNEKLKFANYIPHKETLYDEFERCLTDHHHDDIPDVISHHPRYAPKMAQVVDEGLQENFSTMDAAANANYNLLYGTWLSEDESPADAFGRLGMGPRQTIVEEIMEPEPEMQAETPFPGMPSILGGGIYG